MLYISDKIVEMKQIQTESLFKIISILDDIKMNIKDQIYLNLVNYLHSIFKALPYPKKEYLPLIIQYLNKIKIDVDSQIYFDIECHLQIIFKNIPKRNNSESVTGYDSVLVSVTGLLNLINNDGSQDIMLMGSSLLTQHP